MAYCSHCGTKIDDGDKFCPICGAAQQKTYENTYDNNQYTDPCIEKASGKLNVGQLVWSIINLVICCTPMGIASLILTILANDASSAENERKQLKAAKICNLIGTIAIAALIVVYVILVAVGVGLSLS